MKYLHFRNESLAHLRAIDDLITEVITLKNKPFEFFTGLIFSRETIIVSGNVDRYSFILWLLICNKRANIILHISSCKTTILHSYLLLTLSRKKRMGFAFVTNFVRDHFEKSLQSETTQRASTVHHFSRLFDIGEFRYLVEIKYDFLFLGRLDSRRGIKEYISLARANPGSRFAVAGDGPLRALVEQEAFLLENLEYVGFVDGSQKMELLSCSKCLVSMMRETENFGISIAEALTIGVSVICPSDYGPAEIVGPSFVGYDKGELQAGCFDAFGFSQRILFDEKYRNTHISINLSKEIVRSRWMVLVDD
jgi:glycosyltransferase involved in cell wall biosynthesis